MTECNVIIEANNEIDELKRENKKLNESCVRYGFEVGRLEEENEQLKQYKQSVNDVLKSWSQKNLTAKQLQVVLVIMEELNVIGDVEWLIIVQYAEHH